MASPNSIDELFLKALDLNGPKRRAFLRTLPAQTRAKVSSLLAADESVEKKEFLEEGFLESEACEDKGRRVTGKRSTEVASDNRAARGQSVGQPRRLPRKTRTESGLGSKKTADSKTPQRSKSKHKPQQKSGPGFAVIAMTATAVIACGGLVWLIVSSLRGESTVVAEQNQRLETPVATAPDSLEVASDTAIKSPAVKTSAEDAAPSGFVAGEPVFYTSATSAPPATKQELLELSKAMSPAALVTSPKQLPGVRSWTIDTVGYREGVGCMDLSRDGKLFAFACRDGNVRIVDSQSGSLAKIIAMEDGLPEWVRWGDSTKVMFVSVRTGDVRSLVRIDSEFGKTTHKVPLGEAVFSITQDGQSVYAHRGSQLHVLSVNDLTSREALELPLGHGAIWLSQDDQFLMTNARQSLTVFRNIRPLEIVLTAERKADLTVSSWSTDGKLATGWKDGMVVVYDPAKSVVDPIAEVKAHNGAALGRNSSVCWSWLNDDVVLTTGSSSKIKLVSVSRRAVVQEANSGGYSASLCYRPEFRLGAVGGSNIHELNAARIGRQLLAGDAAGLRSVGYTSNGEVLCVAGRRIKAVQLRTGAVTRLANKVNGGAPFSHIDGSHRRYRHTIRDGRTPFLLDGVTGEVLQEWNFGNSGPLQMRWIEDQTRLAVPCRDGSVLICTPGNPMPWRLPIPPETKIQTTLWNPTTQTTLLIGETEIYEWDPTTNSIDLVGTHEVETPYYAVWNPSRTHLALGGLPVTILNGITLEPEVIKDVKTTGIKWLSDDELIMISYRGDSLHRLRVSSPETVIDTSTGAMIYGSQWSSSFSPTAPVIAGTFPGNQVRFLDLRNGAHLGTLVFFGDKDHATIAPDGRILQTTGGVQEQIVYQIRTDRGQETLRPAEFRNRFGADLVN